MYCAIWKAVDCRVVTLHDWNWCSIVNPGISLINMPEQNFLVRCWIRCVFYDLRARASTVQVEFWGSIQKLCLIISFLWSLISVLFLKSIYRKQCSPAQYSLLSTGLNYIYHFLWDFSAQEQTIKVSRLSFSELRFLPNEQKDAVVWVTPPASYSSSRHRWT